MSNNHPQILIENVSHNFKLPDTKQALKIIDNISLSVRKGESVGILGPSGCGKTTLLKIIAGLIIPEEGIIKIDGKDLTGISKDRILLFQELFLFEWLTVEKNISFSFEIKGVEKSLHHELVNDILKAVGLEGFQSYYPSEISGGMKQRLALARSLAMTPSVLLLDEPFSSLDFSAKLELENQYNELKYSKSFTSIIVTHDVRQALYLADKILILSARPAKIIEVLDLKDLGEKNIQMWETSEFHKLQVELTKKINRS
jgi:ABC-type nitrate/sulfonate/bicarbonate transport system ATPase subunit